MPSSNNDKRKTIDEFAPKPGQSKEQIRATSRKAIKRANGSRDKHGAALAIGGPIAVVVLLVVVFVVITMNHHGGSSKAKTKPSSSTSASSPAKPNPTKVTAAEDRTTTGPWDRPSDMAAQVAAAGLSLTPSEQLAVHYHSHLDVIVNGKAVTVPAGLGINESPTGGAPAMGAAGIAPLHTHDTSGVLHIEAPAKADFTLGQVFTEWGVAFSANKLGGYGSNGPGGEVVRVYVNGNLYTSNPTKLVLSKHEEIAVIVAPSAEAIGKIPVHYAFPAGL